MVHHSKEEGSPKGNGCEFLHQQKKKTEVNIQGKVLIIIIPITLNYSYAQINRYSVNLIKVILIAFILTSSSNSIGDAKDVNGNL